MADTALDEELLGRIDAWRTRQQTPLSRSQAIAELVRAGLRGDPPGAGLSLGDKLILSILCDVSRKVEATGMIDPDFLEAAIKGGHSWAIEWEHPSLAHSHTNSQTAADFVIRVLSMWKQIEDSFASLSEADKNRVRQEAGLARDPSFPGWHREQEANYKSTARFMTDRMNLFPAFEGRSAADSGEPVVACYKRMLSRLELSDAATGDQPLGAEQLVDLLRGD